MEDHFSTMKMERARPEEDGIVVALSELSHTQADLSFKGMVRAKR